DLRAREHAQLPGLDIGGRDEEFETAIAADRLEVDEALDQLLERIDVERIEIVGRQHGRHRAEPQAVARNKREQPLHHAALQVSEVDVDADRAPEIGEALARLVRPAAGKPVGEHHRVDRSRRRAGDAFDRDAAVVEQLIEHPPGEGAVGAAALQRQIDRLGAALARARGRLATPAWRARRERAGNEVCKQNGEHSRMPMSGAPRGKGLAQCGDGIAALQYQIMAVQQSQKMSKTGKVRACRNPKPRERPRIGRPPCSRTPITTTIAAQAMPWRWPRRCARNAASACRRPAATCSPRYPPATSRWAPTRSSTGSRSRGRAWRRSPPTARSSSCARTAWCTASRAAMRSSPACTITPPARWWCF